MISIPPSWIVAGVVVLGVATYVVHCEGVKSKLAKQAGIAQEQARQNALQALRDLKKKERADENYDRRIARLNADLVRQRPSLLPAPSATAPSAATIAFDRAELDAALTRFVERVEGIAAEGEKARIGLDEARRWAQP